MSGDSFLELLDLLFAELGLFEVSPPVEISQLI